MINSNTILQIIQDIYAIGGEFSSLTDAFLSMEIDKPTYDKHCYILICKTHFLEGIVEEVRKTGYKFKRYEKEIRLLNCLSEEIENCFTILNVSEINKIEEQTLLELTQKYQNIVDIFENDLNEKDLIN